MREKKLFAGLTAVWDQLLAAAEARTPSRSPGGRSFPGAARGEPGGRPGRARPAGWLGSGEAPGDAGDPCLSG